MNGCKYCVIMHNRKRRGRKRARGMAMCLARGELTPCDKKLDERGLGCEYHDAKVEETNHLAPEPEPVVAVRGRRTPRPEPIASEAI